MDGLFILFSANVLLGKTKRHMQKLSSCLKGQYHDHGSNIIKQGPEHTYYTTSARITKHTSIVWAHLVMADWTVANYL